MSDLLEVKITGELEGRRVTNGFGFHKSTGPLDANRALLMLNAFNAHFHAAWLAMLSHDYALQQYSCRDIERAVCAPNYIAMPQNQGAIAEQAMPSSQASIIRLGVDADSGHHNGRLYIAGTPETAVLDQRLTAAYKTGVVQDFADLLLDDIVLTDGSTWQLVVFVRDRTGHPPALADWNPVIQATPLDKLITQRKRLTELLGTTST
jgi:hypothetical protein